MEMEIVVCLDHYVIFLFFSFIFLPLLSTHSMGNISTKFEVSKTNEPEHNRQKDGPTDLFYDIVLWGRPYKT